jgi:hypothetical protein
MRPEPPRIRAIRRKGRCYELTGRGHLRDETWTIVHGQVAFWSLRRNPLLIAHAWLEKDGYVYDATLDQVMTAKQYRTRYKARIERRYSARQVQRLMLTTETWGPWHDCDMITVAPFVSRGLAAAYQALLGQRRRRNRRSANAQRVSGKMKCE